MDHAQSACNQIPFANHFVDRNGDELRHLIRARDKAGAATRPKQLGVPNVAGLAVAVGEGKVEDGSQYAAVSFEIRTSVLPRNQRRKDKTPSGDVRRAAAPTQHRNRTSQPVRSTSLRNFIPSPVVKFGCSRRLMTGHLLETFWH